MTDRLINQQPPLPDFSAESLKKYHSQEIREYIEALSFFAEESGVWYSLLQAIERASYFVDLSKPGSTLPDDNPAQGLLFTGYEGGYHPEMAPDYFEKNFEVIDIREEYPDLVKQSLNTWMLHLAQANHPEYLDYLYRTVSEPYQGPTLSSDAEDFLSSLEDKNSSASVRDLALRSGKADKPRIHRTEVQLKQFHNSQWVKNEDGEIIGRRQARRMVVGGDNPSVFGSPVILATLAANHCLSAVPKDGPFKDIARQASLAKEALDLLPEFVKLVGRDDDERQLLLDWYVHNIMGVIDAHPDKGEERTRALYKAGIRIFRIYSAEPNSEVAECVRRLRKIEKEEGWEPIEIFAGQIVDADQAMEVEQAGANAIIVGRGGGGRCITGLLADLTVDMPIEVLEIRGHIHIPIFVQGGGNDHMTLVSGLGAAGAGATGSFAGTIEATGGFLYFRDKKTGEIFRFYFGEASAVMKFLAGIYDLVGRTPNKEGDITRKGIIPVVEPGIYPVAMQRVAEIEESLAGGMAQQSTGTLAELFEVGPGRVALIVNMDGARGTH